MTDIDALAAWLRQQLDEDERLARAACWDDQSDVWAASPPREKYERYTVVDYLDDGVVAVTPENADADGVGQHVAEWDPARVLREVDAKRRLLDDCEMVLTERDDDNGHLLTNPIGRQFARSTIYLLTLPYADRDGYRT